MVYVSTVIMFHSMGHPPSNELRLSSLDYDYGTPPYDDQQYMYPPDDVPMNYDYPPWNGYGTPPMVIMTTELRRTMFHMNYDYPPWNGYGTPPEW